MKFVGEMVRWMAGGQHKALRNQSDGLSGRRPVSCLAGWPRMVHGGTRTAGSMVTSRLVCTSGWALG